MKRISILVPAALLIILSGCSTIRHHTMPAEDNTLSGAGSIMVGKKDQKAEEFELIDVEDLIDKHGLADKDMPKKQAENAASKDEFQYRRNDLQDRIIAASNQKCGTFLRTLVSSKSQTQMGWSGLATFLSTAATVTTPTSAVRILSAGSAVSNSFLSLYNEAYFNSLTINVISSGITKQREGLLRNMTDERRKPLADYPVNRAISDAVAYHSACNIITGLEVAAIAVKSADLATVVPKTE